MMDSMNPSVDQAHLDAPQSPGTLQELHKIDQDALTPLGPYSPQANPV